jgi:hypothetical protein
MTRSLWIVACAALALFASTGCAALGAKRGPRGVPVESRPTPPQPDESGSTAANGTSSKPATGAPRGTTTAPPPEPNVKVAQALTPEQRRATLANVVADTTEAGAAARRCFGLKLLPDQENVLDATLTYLADTREALIKDELSRAESLARKARQLASSLKCP